MTGKQLFERARQLGLVPYNYAFDQYTSPIQATWNYLAEEVGRDMKPSEQALLDATACGAAMHGEKYHRQG